MDLDSPEVFRSALGTSEAGDLLRSRAELVPQVAVIRLLGADGEWVNSSRDGPAAQPDGPDQAVAAHFAAVRDTHLFISEPVMPRSSGEWSVMLARGIYGPAGQYVGVVLATLPLYVFSDFYASITLRAEASYLLARRDGIVLVRHPDATARAGQRIPAGSDWYRLVAQGGGSLTVPGYFDAVERLLTVRPLFDYPLVTNVGIGRQAALAAWRRESTTLALVTLGGATCLLLLLRALQRRFAKLQRSQAALRGRIAELTAAEAERKAAADALVSTLAALDQGLMMVDAAGMVAVCNRRAMDMLELPEKLIASRPSFAAVAAGWPAVDAVNAVPVPDDGTPAGSPRSGIRTWHTASGEVLEIRRVGLAGGGFVATFDDVTARRQSRHGLMLPRPHAAPQGHAARQLALT
jgi:PAS domain-containing protein